jgi:DNA-binding transcriptional LysR family regulator
MKATFRIGALGGLSKNLQLRILAPALKDPEVELSLVVGDADNLAARLADYSIDAALSDRPLPSDAARPLTQVEIASEPICLVSRKKPSARNQKRSNEMPVALKAAGLYLPERGSPTTSALQEFAGEASIPIRGYVDDIAFLRLLALETDSMIAIPKIGVARELESKELHVVHEFRKIKQGFFLVFRQKGKRHPTAQRILDGAEL